MTFKTKKGRRTYSGVGLSGLTKIRLGKVVFCQSFSEDWMEMCHVSPPLPLSPNNF